MTKHIWYLKSFLLLTGILGIFVFFSFVRAEEIDMNIIARIESSSNPFAYNPRTKATGLYQITPICLKEFNQYKKKNYTLFSLFNPKRNYEVANWYMNKRIPQMLKYYGKEDTIVNRLICYNAGISYVVNNLPLKKETKEYIEKYFN